MLLFLGIWGIQALTGFQAKVLPPLIVMQTSDSENPGRLLTYEFRQGENFAQLNALENLTVRQPSGAFDVAKLSKTIKTSLNDTEMITLKNTSNLRFFIKDFPPRIIPNSFYVTVYEKHQGNPVRVLGEENSSAGMIKIELPKSSYIILGSLTWTPNNATGVAGFAIYAWNVKIV